MGSQKLGKPHYPSFSFLLPQRGPVLGRPRSYTLVGGWASSDGRGGGPLRPVAIRGPPWALPPPPLLGLPLGEMPGGEKRTPADVKVQGGGPYNQKVNLTHAPPPGAGEGF